MLYVDFSNVSRAPTNRMINFANEIAETLELDARAEYMTYDQCHSFISTYIDEYRRYCELQAAQDEMAFWKYFGRSEGY